MAKPQSEEKREAIIAHGKRLFAERGFAATSVAGIAEAAGLPVGSIYTYFENKDEVLHAIISEGWSELWQRLQAAVMQERSPEAKLQVLIDRFLPEVIQDSSFVSILISEASEKTDLKSKIDAIVTLLESILEPIQEQVHPAAQMTRKQLEGALLVYFLGTLNAVKLSADGALGVSLEDILSFLRLTVSGNIALRTQNISRR